MELENRHRSIVIKSRSPKTLILQEVIHGGSYLLLSVILHNDILSPRMRTERVLQGLNWDHFIPSEV